MCEGGYCDPSAEYGYDGFIKVKDLGLGKYGPPLDVRNELSCLCCSGKATVLPIFGGKGRADDLAGDAAIWEKIQNDIDTTGSVSVDMLGEASAMLDDEAAGRAGGGSWKYWNFKLFCHELPITPTYSFLPKLDYILGACPAEYSPAP